jgi:hypothetical protein
MGLVVSMDIAAATRRMVGLVILDDRDFTDEAMSLPVKRVFEFDLGHGKHGSYHDEQIEEAWAFIVKVSQRCVVDLRTKG